MSCSKWRECRQPPSLCLFSVLYKNFLLFTCTCVCLYVGMCICLWCPEMSQEGVGSSAAEFTGGCEQPNMGSGNQTWGPLEKQQLLRSLSRPTIWQSLILLHSSPGWCLACPPLACSCGVDSAMFSPWLLALTSHISLSALTQPSSNPSTASTYLQGRMKSISFRFKRKVFCFAWNGF